MLPDSRKSARGLDRERGTGAGLLLARRRLGLRSHTNLCEPKMRAHADISTSMDIEACKQSV
eukprot:3158906-Rhodomonas_salina.5